MLQHGDLLCKLDALCPLLMTLRTCIFLIHTANKNILFYTIFDCTSALDTDTKELRLGAGAHISFQQRRVHFGSLNELANKCQTGEKCTGSEKSFS